MGEGNELEVRAGGLTPVKEKILSCFYGVENPLSITQKLAHSPSPLIGLLDEPSDRFKGVSEEFFRHLQANNLAGVPAIQGMLDYFNDSRYCLIEEGRGHPANYVRRIKTDDKALVEYLVRRGRLEDFLLETGIVTSRRLDDPRSKFAFRKGDLFRLTDAKAGDTVRLTDYKGRVLLVELPDNYDQSREYKVRVVKGTDIQRLKAFIDRPFSMSIFHPPDERFSDIPGLDFEYDYVVCVPPNASQSQIEERYSESYAGRLKLTDLGSEKPLLNLRLREVEIEPDDQREKLKLKALNQRISSGNQAILSQVDFELGTNIARIRKGGYYVKLRKENDEIVYAKIYEEGTDIFEEYHLADGYKVAFCKAGNGWVALPGINEDGSPNYRGDGTPVHLSEKANVIEMIGNFVSQQE